MIVNTYTIILTKKKEISREVISIYSCHPCMVKKWNVRRTCFCLC
jgi:hypothetical protein